MQQCMQRHAGVGVAGRRVLAGLPAVRRHAPVLRAASIEAPSTGAPQSDAPPHHPEVFTNLCCPICLNERFAMPHGMPTRPTGLSCPRCGRTFNSSAEYVDLTLTSGKPFKVYSERSWGGTETFRNPLVSFVYERGWRQAFAWAGFPGADKEYDMAMAYLQPAYGKVLVDMSCGSGLFSRRFARSGQFTGVVAADFSESMLQQARAYFQEDGTLPRATINAMSPPASTATPTITGKPPASPVLLLRADVGRLPFATGSVAGIHAGAAIHCWPNPQAALAEISRVLAPGGVFVASTFLVPTAPLGEVLGDDFVRPLNMTMDAALVRNQYRWWEEAELRDLCEGVGLVDFTRTRRNRFIMFCAYKPEHVPTTESYDN